MRVLFTTLAGIGHFHPLVPIARALTAAGHEVCFATAEDFAPRVRAAGFRCEVAGHLESFAPPMETETIGVQRQLWVVREIFARIRAKKLAEDVLALSERFRPDLIVRDTLEYGGCVAAERLGIPHASVTSGQLDSADWVVSSVAPAVSEVREAFGLPADPTGEALFRYLHLSYIPPFFRNPELTRVRTHHVLRPTAENPYHAQGLPPYVPGLGRDRPKVYATLGTSFNNPRLLAVILEALRDEPVHLIASTGPGVEPAEFGPQPPNVHIEPYIPNPLIMPHVDLVVAHGGPGTVFDALHQGVPLVVIPIAADHESNAKRCEELGIARQVLADSWKPEVIRAAAREVLGDGRFRERARALQTQFQALPPPEHAVRLLEQLVRERRPLVAA